MKKFVLGVDLDGTCADFYRGLKPIAAEWMGVEVNSLTDNVTWNLPEWGIDQAPGGYEALHRFAVTQRDLFKRLLPMENAPSVLRKLTKEQVRIRIITHRLFIKYFHKIAVAQTIEWLDYHDIPYWDICFMADKTAVGADLYIEDSPSNIVKLTEEGCKTIIYNNSTNLDIEGIRASNWNEVYDIVSEQKMIFYSI